MTTTFDPEQPGLLPTDGVVVRNLAEGDLRKIVSIDQAAMGRPREEYYRAKVQAALASGKLQTSLVAELDGHVVGFLVTHVFYGEFGHAEPVAVIDSIGVDPAFRGRHVGQALLGQLIMNLRALGVERLETQVDWGQFDLLRFLAAAGFRPAERFCLEREL